MFIFGPAPFLPWTVLHGNPLKLKSILLLQYPPVRQQGRTLLPQVVAYAAVLDRLNWAISRDWRLLEACHEVWSGSHSLLSTLKEFGAFEAAKAHLIEGATIKLKSDIMGP